MKTTSLATLVLVLGWAMGLVTGPVWAQSDRPNIVVILADDLGIGDVGAYHADESKSKIPTPRMDGLAGEGMRFMDAHSPSAVCTPTRYAFLTGRYAWRTRLKAWVLNGESRALIEPGRETLASMLKGKGYRTACIGKWHLGLGPFDEEKPNAKTDFSGAIGYGPREVGFDEVFVIPASLDMPPYVYVDGDRINSPLTKQTPGSKRRWSGGEGFWRAGAVGEDFDFYECLPRVTERAVSFVKTSAEAEEPFFLYMPLPAPHTPWMPTDAFQGASEAGWYGDFVAQVDASVGRVLDAIDNAGVRENTLVIVTSDNGAHWRPADIEAYGHQSHLGYRGMKADIYEAGHRVPFIVRWPGRVKAGSTTDALVGLHDVFASVREIVGSDVEPGNGEDSASFVGVLTGEEAKGREMLVHHSGNGTFALRWGEWKLIEGLGSGGFTRPAKLEPAEGQPAWQLYNLETDPGETTNLASTHAIVLNRLRVALRAIRASGEQAEDADD